jgi:protein-tyrosine-phosphatase
MFDDDAEVMTGGYSPPRSHSPLRRNGSRQAHMALEVGSACSSPRQLGSPEENEPWSHAGRHLKQHPPAGWLSFSATPSKNKFLPAPVLERIAKGDVDAAMLEGAQASCATSLCGAHRRSRRIAQALFCACFALLLLAVSRGSAVSVSAFSAQEQASPDPSKPGQTPFRMLTVCTGNTCRSPMMMALLRMELHRLGLKNVVVESAGIGERAALHRPASAHALTLFPEALKEHRSSRITSHAMSAYDRIFCMTDAHKVAVIEQCALEVRNSSALKISEESGQVADTTRSGGNDTSALPELRLRARKESYPSNAVGDAAWAAEESEDDDCAGRVSVFPGGLEDPFNKTLVRFVRLVSTTPGAVRALELHACESGHMARLAPVSSCFSAALVLIPQGLCRVALSFAENYWRWPRCAMSCRCAPLSARGYSIS